MSVYGLYDEEKKVYEYWDEEIYFKCYWIRYLREIIVFVINEIGEWL